MVIERLVFVSFHVCLGEISKNISFETVFSDIKLSQAETILPNEL